MKYRVKILDETYELRLIAVKYVADRNLDLTDDQEEALVFDTELEAEDYLDKVRFKLPHNSNQNRWAYLERVLDDSYSCLIKITSGISRTKLDTKEFKLNSKDLLRTDRKFGSDEFLTPAEYCSEWFMLHKDSLSNNTKLLIEYSEDGGSSWVTHCREN